MSSRINQLTPEATVDLTKVIPAQIATGDIEPITYTGTQLKEAYTTLEIAELTPEGSTDSTTARLVYGLNVVETSSSSNFCTRLPETPTEGRNVVIVNKSSYVVRVFPSVTGGSINGVVDGYVDIPADNQAYSVYCYENPDPGDWGADPIVTNIFDVSEMSIVHTNSVADSYAGTGTAVSGAPSVGIDGSQNLTLSPAFANWKSLDIETSFVKLRVATNIVAADYSSGSPIVCSINTGYKSAAGSANLDLGTQITFTSAPSPSGSGGAVNGGVLASPPNVGDTGTLYASLNQITSNIGLGGTYSRYYFIFFMSIPASWPSKTYKFKFSLEYL